MLEKPDPQKFNDFSIRMAHRQFYILHRNDIEFEVKTRFLLKEGEIELRSENEIWNDLLFHPQTDYASRMYEELLVEPCDGFLITRKFKNNSKKLNFAQNFCLP